MLTSRIVQAILLLGGLLLAACDSTVEVNVKGTAYDVDTFAAGRFQGKTGVIALAGAQRAGAVAYPDVSPTSKSVPTKADGTWKFTFRALPESTFRVMTEGGPHPAGLWPVVYKVPAAKDIVGGTVAIDAGGDFECRNDAVQLAVAKSAGFVDVADMLKTSGTCMYINLGKGAFPDITLTTDAKIAVKNPEVGVEIKPVTMTANMESAVVADSSPLGLYIILKKFAAAEKDEIVVRLQTSDPVTDAAAGRPFRFNEISCPIKKGRVTDLINAPAP